MSLLLDMHCNIFLFVSLSVLLSDDVNNSVEALIILNRYKVYCAV